MSDADSLIIKYRPQSFIGIWGHKEVVASLKHVLNEGISHSFLFTGPTGVGKTSLARLVAKHVRARIREVDAGQYTGIDAMRELLDSLRTIPLGGENQCYILNEVQSLSSKAWDALLMSIEEPPSWLYFCLTTTEENKVPKTLNRCLKYSLKELSDDELTDLLEAINDAEGYNTPNSILGLCARSSTGSPRLAISNYALCSGVHDYEEACRLLEEHEKPADAYELIRALVARKDWQQIQPILERLGKTNPESVRHTCREYLTKAILGSKDPDKARSLFEMLDHFSFPFNDHDGISPVVLAVGRILFAQEI